MNTININKKSTSLRLNSGLYSHIEKLAKQENCSLDNFIETSIFDVWITENQTKKLN